MKNKLLAIVFVLALMPAGIAEAKSDNQKTPRWVKQAWQDGKRCPNIERDLRTHGLPVKAFSYLAWRESRCIRSAIGWNYHRGLSSKNCVRASAVDQYKKCFAVRSYDSGLLQINSSWVTVTANVCGSKWGDLRVLRRKSCNLQVAKYLFDNGGFHHWIR
jgi:hypothetical protein